MYTMTEENIFQERFLRLIGEKSLRQVEKETGITAGALSHYGTAKRSPTGEMLKKLAQYFCVSIDYLLGISDDPQPRPNLSAMSNEELVLKLRNLGYDVKPINPEELRSIPILGRVTAGIDNAVSAILKGILSNKLEEEVKRLEARKKQLNEELLTLARGSGKRITTEEVKGIYMRYEQMLLGDETEQRALILDLIERVEVFPEGFLNIVPK